MGDATVVLVPGAWMGSWIWEPTARRLREAGVRAEVASLRGLDGETEPAALASIGLADHVDDVLDLVDALGDEPIVLVGHSYSGMVVGQVADQRSDRVVMTVHVGSFLPRDGRSLLDDWGDDPEARDAERSAIVAADMAWEPPPIEALREQPDLTDDQVSWLAERFVAHPGRTVLDPATMSRPVTTQPGVYVADDPDELPSELEASTPPAWRVVPLGGGHWPMLTRSDELESAIRAAAVA